MRRIIAILASALLAGFPGPALAQNEDARGVSAYRVVTTTSWIEEWDPDARRWVRIVDSEPAHSAKVCPQSGAALMEPNPAPLYSPGRISLAQRNRGLARYGPFIILDHRRAAIIGSTGSAAPFHFDALVRDHPELRTLEFLEAPGTSDDIANLAVGRRIRAAGLTTHVPRGGSVRSGAVELFLAGATRRIDAGARFAVHAWLDNYGREPDDFASDAPANRLYLDYYIEMGMSPERARAFYTMTNSVPHTSARWLGAEEMRRWIRPEAIDNRAALDAPQITSQSVAILLDSQGAFP